LLLTFSERFLDCTGHRVAFAIAHFTLFYVVGRLWRLSSFKQLFQKKIGREISILAFTTDRLFKIFSVSLPELFRAKSQPMFLAAATTNLIFKARFVHNLNLYKKVYIQNVKNRTRFVK